MLMLSGPSGVGKTTVGKRLLEENADLRKVVTCTTREPRDGEARGVDYHFLSYEEFMRAIAEGEFLEHAEVYGWKYGTRHNDVWSQLEGGMDVLLVNDVQGAETIRELAVGDELLGSALVTVCLVTETLEGLKARLEERGKDGLEVIQQRLVEAEREIARAEDFDHTLVSGTREEDWQRVQEIYERSKNE